MYNVFGRRWTELLLVIFPLLWDVLERLQLVIQTVGYCHFYGFSFPILCAILYVIYVLLCTVFWVFFHVCVWMYISVSMCALIIMWLYMCMHAWIYLYIVLCVCLCIFNIVTHTEGGRKHWFIAYGSKSGVHWPHNCSSSYIWSILPRQASRRHLIGSNFLYAIYSYYTVHRIVWNRAAQVIGYVRIEQVRSCDRDSVGAQVNPTPRRPHHKHSLSPPPHSRQQWCTWPTYSYHHHHPVLPKCLTLQGILLLS